MELTPKNTFKKLIVVGDRVLIKPKKEEERTKGGLQYVPLQAREGDLAIFLQKGAIEVMYKDEKYFIVSQSSILMLEREEDIFE
jgi:chaperonin GroES